MSTAAAGKALVRSSFPELRPHPSDTPILAMWRFYEPGDWCRHPLVWRRRELTPGWVQWDTTAVDVLCFQCQEVTFMDVEDLPWLLADTLDECLRLMHPWRAR